MVKEATLFILDSSASMGQSQFPCRGIPSSQTALHTITPNRAHVNRLSFAQETIEELIYHLLLQTPHTHEIGVLECNLPQSIHSDDSAQCEATDEDDSIGSSNALKQLKFQQVSVSLLQSIHHHFGKETNHHNIINPRYNLPAYQLSHGNVVDSIILAAEIFQKHSSIELNKTTTIRFKIVLLTDASDRFVDMDLDKLDSALQILGKLSCTLFIIGFDFIHSHVKHFTPSTYNDSSEDEGRDDQSNVMNSDTLVQLENERFIIRLAQELGGTLYPIHSYRSWKAAVTACLTPVVTHKQWLSKKKMELVLAKNLSITTRMSILISKANLPSLKKEVVLTDPETGDTMINGAGEVMTSRVKTTTLYWDAENPHMQVSERNRISAVQFGSKDRFPLGIFDMQGLQNRSSSTIKILGYVPFDSIPLGLLIGPTRMIYGDTKRTGAVISALSRSMYQMKVIALCAFVLRDDSDAQMGVMIPDLDSNNTSHDFLLLLRFPFADDIQNLSSGIHMGDFSELFTEEQESSCDALIDALMLPCDKSNESHGDPKIATNPTLRLFHHSARDKVTHIHASVPCKHHTSGDTSFVRWRRKIASSASVDEDDEEENLLSTSSVVLEKARPALEQFRERFPLLRETKKVQKRYWSDSY